MRQLRLCATPTQLSTPHLRAPKSYNHHPHLGTETVLPVEGTREALREGGVLLPRFWSRGTPPPTGARLLQCATARRQTSSKFYECRGTATLLPAVSTAVVAPSPANPQVRNGKFFLRCSGSQRAARSVAPTPCSLLSFDQPAHYSHPATVSSSSASPAHSTMWILLVTSDRHGSA